MALFIHVGTLEDESVHGLRVNDLLPLNLVIVVYKHGKQATLTLSQNICIRLPSSKAASISSTATEGSTLYSAYWNELQRGLGDYTQKRNS
jgi:hypothetical protein